VLSPTHTLPAARLHNSEAVTNMLDYFINMTELNMREILGSKSEGIDAHLVSLGELCKRFGTVCPSYTDTDQFDIKGLTEEQAKENLKKYGPNKIERKEPSGVKNGYFLRCVKAILRVIGLGEYREEFAMVKRENEWKQIKTEDLVPGDVVKISWSNIPAGKRGKVEKLCIPADIRVLQRSQFPISYVESYFLYRECLNFEKLVTFNQIREDPIDSSLEECNLIFEGSSISSGEVEGIVFQTGENMLLSKVSPDLLATPVFTDSDDEENEVDEKPGELVEYSHEDTIENICATFNSDINKGLSAEQAAINQKISGINGKGRGKDFTRVKRDGKFQNILTKHLTIGDIVSLKKFQFVPADIRVVEVDSDECYVIKEMLTGD